MSSPQPVQPWYPNQQGGYPNQQYRPLGPSGQPYDEKLARDMYEATATFNTQELDQRFKISQNDISARLKMAGQESKDRRFGIEQGREAEREKLAFAREEMERLGIPRMLIEKYVAEKTYEIAAAEMTLKRDVFVEETAQARARIQLDREEMERVGIPRMEIERYTAEENARIARGQLGLNEAETTGYYGGQSTLKREQFRSDDEYRRAQAAESARQFNVGATGYMQQPGQLSAEQQSRYQQIRARDEQLRAAGQPGVSAAERAELAGYEDVLAGRAGGGPGAPTLERERFGADEAERQRRYALDVGKFGAELASTPDTYFQARRFQGVDVPRLLGGAGAATTDVAGGPTPGVATMGAYLSGQDPYGQQAQAYPEAAATAPGAPPPAAPGAPPAPGGGGLSPAEQSRYTQLVSRQQQLAAAGEPGLAPEDVAELQRYVARGAAAPGGPAGPGGSPLSAQEQARYAQLVARQQQLQQAGEAIPPEDAAELQRFVARGAPEPSAPLQPPSAPISPYGSPSPRGGGIGYGGQPGAPGTTTSYDEGGGMFDPGGYRTAGGSIAMPTFTGGGGQPRGGGIGYGGQPGAPGAPTSYDEGGGGFETGWYTPSDQYGGGGGGGGFPDIDPVSGGSTLPLSTYGGGTKSVYGGPAVSASVGPQGYRMPAWYTQQASRAPSQYPSQDPRQKQVAALAKAMPPSPYDGLNEQDSAALKAMESIYKGGGQSIAGGEYERLKSSGRLGFLQSAGRLLGRDPKELESQYLSYRPSQGSSRMAG